jgi:hypothetical protein
MQNKKCPKALFTISAPREEKARKSLAHFSLGKGTYPNG